MGRGQSCQQTQGSNVLYSPVPSRGEVALEPQETTEEVILYCSVKDGARPRGHYPDTGLVEVSNTNLKVLTDQYGHCTDLWEDDTRGVPDKVKAEGDLSEIVYCPEHSTACELCPKPGWLTRIQKF